MTGQEDMSSVVVYPGKRTGPNYHFISKPGSDQLVIFFSATGKNDGKFDFWVIGQKVNANLLFVSDGKNRWYQSGVPGLGTSIETTVDSIQKWCVALNVKKIYTIGASMGGYGAVLFGCLLRAKVLAFSLDSKLKVPGSRSRKQMPPAEELRHPDLVPLISRSKTTIQLFAGEMDTMDIYGASRLRDIPTVSIETIRGVDHRSPRYLLEHVGLLETIQLFMANQPLIKMFEVGDILEKPQVASLLHSAYMAFLESNWKESVNFCLAALKIDPNNEAIRMQLGKSLLKLKRYVEAIPHLAFVFATLPNYEEGAFHFAHALRLDHQYKRALDVFRRQLTKWPDSARIHYNMALIYQSEGRVEEALQSIEKAHTLEPQQPNYAKHLTAIRKSHALGTAVNLTRDIVF